MTPSHPAFALVVAAAVLGAASGHEHDKQHSHFCEGGGYNLFCPDGQTLRIDKAWYGRVAHDTSSCVAKAIPGASVTSAPQPDLAEDCGSSLLESKAGWCQNADKGGCTIAVKNLEPKVEEKKCPEGVIKYLYLEYECLPKGSGESLSAHTGTMLLAVLSVLSLYIMSF